MTCKSNLFKLSSCVFPFRSMASFHDSTQSRMMANRLSGVPSEISRLSQLMSPSTVKQFAPWDRVDGSVPVPTVSTISFTCVLKGFGLGASLLPSLRAEYKVSRWAFWGVLLNSLPGGYFERYRRSLGYPQTTSELLRTLLKMSCVADPVIRGKCCCCFFFYGRRKPECPREKPFWKGRKPTSNSTHTWYPCSQRVQCAPPKLLQVKTKSVKMKRTVSQTVPRRSIIKQVPVELLSLRISSRCLHDCLWMENCLILILVPMFWNANISPVKILCMINPHWMIVYLTAADI